MHPHRLLTSATFRYALIYVVVFGLSVCGILGFVYWRVADVVSAQTDDTIRTEINSLAEHYREFGLGQLIQIIRERSAGRPGRRGIYLLAGPDLQPLAGNLTAWPTVAKGEPGWIDFLIESEGDTTGKPQVARAHTFVLSGGLRLLVGRDTTERSELRSVIGETLVGALILSTLLAILGGVLMSRNLLRRIDAINRGSHAILAGDLKQRMPTAGSGDEFDQLAGNLNHMLDRIEQLMAGMRNVGNDIAHDLRSPISRLRSRLEVTLLKAQDAETYRAAIEETVTEIENILGTFNAILAIALAESGALRADFEELDLASLLADVAELYEPLAEESGSPLTVAMAPDLRVRGNRHLLSQTFANLLDNAVKYGGGRGVIRVSAMHRDRAIEITVADGGPGIAPEQRDEALKRFVRLESSRSAPGSGLGLALVAAVARLHQWELRLEDNEPGLRVVLRVPIGDATRQKKSGAGGGTGAASRGGLGNGG